MSLTVRRHRMLKRFSCLDSGDEELAAVWRSKQEGTPATALPSDTPARAALVAAGYSAVEDIGDAVAAELVQRANLTTREAAAVVAYIAAL